MAIKAHSRSSSGDQEFELLKFGTSTILSEKEKQLIRLFDEMKTNHPIVERLENLKTEVFRNHYGRTATGGYLYSQYIKGNFQETYQYNFTPDTFKEMNSLSKQSLNHDTYKEIQQVWNEYCPSDLGTKRSPLKIGRASCRE